MIADVTFGYAGATVNLGLSGSVRSNVVCLYNVDGGRLERHPI